MARENDMMNGMAVGWVCMLGLNLVIGETRFRISFGRRGEGIEESEGDSVADDDEGKREGTAVVGWWP